MDHYTAERLMLEAHRDRIRVAEQRSRLFPATHEQSAVRSWMAGRLRGMADRLDGRKVPAPTQFRVVQ